MGPRRVQGRLGLESAFYASLGVEARAAVDGALSEREIDAERRWLARQQRARTLASELSSPRPAIESVERAEPHSDASPDPDAERQRAWLAQMMAARSKESR